MKKFRFQLDTVLGYKQQVLDNRLVEHGAAVAQVTKQEAVLADARTRMSNYENEFQQKQAEGMTRFEALKYQNCMQALIREVSRSTSRISAEIPELYAGADPRGRSGDRKADPSPAD